MGLFDLASWPSQARMKTSQSVLQGEEEGVIKNKKQ